MAGDSAAGALVSVSAPLAARQTVLGWGMAVGGESDVIAITSQQQLSEVLRWAAAAGKQVALRGSGCSYGDAACGRGKT